MVNSIILFLCLILILAILYTWSNGDVLSPSLLVCLMFILSTTILIFYNSAWDVNLSYKTILYIILAILSLYIGEIFTKKISFKKKNNLKEEQKLPEIKINKWITLILLIYIIVVSILFYKDLIRILSESSYAKTEEAKKYSFLMQVRWAKIIDGLTNNRIIMVAYQIGLAAGRIYTFKIIYNLIFYKKWSKNIFEYGIVIAMLASTFLTTGRTEMLNFIAFIIILSLLLYGKKSDWKAKISFKSYFKIIIAFLFALLLFYLGGLLTEKSLNYDNFFDNLANYTASSIYALNEYIEHPLSFPTQSSLFGVNTFSGLYRFIGKFTYVPEIKVQYEYIQCGKTLTNIYTALRRYIQDFGVFGMTIVMFFEGMFFENLLKKCKNRKFSFLGIIYTAYCYYPLLFMGIEERFFMDLITSTTVYQLVYLFILYKVLKKKKIKI